MFRVWVRFMVSVSVRFRVWVRVSVRLKVWEDWH